MERQEFPIINTPIHGAVERELAVDLQHWEIEQITMRRQGYIP